MLVLVRLVVTLVPDAFDAINHVRGGGRGGSDGGEVAACVSLFDVQRATVIEVGSVEA